MTSARFQAKMTTDDRRPPEDSAFAEGEEPMNEFENADAYVRAHDFIEDLRAERRPTRMESDEADARLHETAALLHAAAPDHAGVDPVFAARLLAHLQAEQRRPAPQPAEQLSLPINEGVDESPVAAPEPRRQGVSRRGLVWGGLGAAAAALAGVGVTAALERNGSSNAPPAGPLVAEGSGSWVAVASAAAVPLGGVARFEAGAVIGYLQHTASGFVALSGVCTHMACLLDWNAGDRTFDCPCHGVKFLSSGKAAPGAPYAYAPLPAIRTKVESGQVWVYVPRSAANDSSSPADNSHGHGYATAEPTK